MTKPTWRWLGLTAVAVLSVHCNSTEDSLSLPDAGAVDAPSIDVQIDTATDTGIDVPTADGGEDAEASVDADADAAVEADAPVEAATDAPAEADAADDTSADAPAEAATDGAVDADAGPPPSAIAIALLQSQPLPLDVCWRAVGASTWNGPVLYTAGGTDGLTYPEVTQPFVVPSAQPLEAIVVAGGSPDCTAAGGTITIPAVPAGTSLTFALWGDLSTLLMGGGYTVLIDEPGAAPGAKVRVFNAVVSPTKIDFAAPSSSVTSIGIPQGTAATQNADANGYLAFAASGAATLQVLPANGTAPLASATVALADGDAKSLYAIGNGVDQPYQILWCDPGEFGGPGLQSCTAIAGQPDGGTDGGTAVTSYLRIADFTGTGTPVDVCLHSTSGGPDGPFLGPFAQQAGLAAGVGDLQMSAAIPVPADTYDVRLVLGGSTDCASALGDGPTLTLPGGARRTLVVTHASGGDPTAFVLADSLSLAPPGNARLRFFHADALAPSPVDVGISTGSFQPVVGGLAFGATPTTAHFGTLDAQGYVTVPGVGAVDLEVRAGDGGASVATASIDVGTGNVATVFLVSGGSPLVPARVVRCNDFVTSGQLTECQPLAAGSGAVEVAHLRVAHLSPDAPALDVCVRPTGTNGAWFGPLAQLENVYTLEYAQVTAYQAIPAAAYDVRVVASGATDCATPFASLPDRAIPALGGDSWSTLVVVGSLDALTMTSPAYGLTLKLLDDAIASPPAANTAMVRPISTAVDPPGLVSVGTGSPVVNQFVEWVQAPFAQAATGGSTDALGYVSVLPSSEIVVSAFDANDQNHLVSATLSAAGGEQITLFVLGWLDGSQPLATPAMFLACSDYAPTGTGYAACRVLPEYVPPNL